MMANETRFISVEVLIRTNADCADWIEWFERQDNYVTKTFDQDHGSLVYFAPLPSADANSTIQKLCHQIDELPENVIRHWVDAEQREFFIGYEVGETLHCFVEHFDTETLELVHRHDASIRVAMYATPTDQD